MHRHLASIAAVALLGAAACSRPAAPSSDLAKDLEAASGPSVELAPRAAGTQIVSDLEQTGGAPKHAPAPRVAPRPRTPTPQRTAPVVVAQAPQAAPAPTPTPEPTTVAVQAPEPTPEADIPPPRPRPAPQGSAPSRRGGYSSVSDVIRRAPFPITP